MRKLLITLAMLCGISSANAQFNYTFSYLTGQPYTPLTTGTNITSGLLWDEESFSVPTGFSFKIGDSTRSNFNIWNTNLSACTDTSGLINGFFGLSADLEDRGMIGGTAKSPIRYSVTGTAPSRIFKLEYFNAGFFDEQDIFGTLDDSVNFQIWVYETSNIVEIHYGDSKVTNETDYFGTPGPIVGFAYQLDTKADTVDAVYCLKGSPSAPVVDSTHDLATKAPPTLTSYPAPGTVYRFAPKSLGIDKPDMAAQFAVYPSRTNATLFIDNAQLIQGNFEIISISGQLTNINGTLVNGKNILDVNPLAPGMYIIQVATDLGRTSYKFIRE